MYKSLVVLGVTKGRQEVTFCSWVLRITVELVSPQRSYILQLGAAYHCGVGSPQHKYKLFYLKLLPFIKLYNIYIYFFLL